ncbi:UNVERIFIED_CONTAM: hypothetical protein FKN15_037744 [Acipenser sinensis]
MPLSDRHPLCMQRLGVQHAKEAMGREDFCDLCTAFQPRVHRNRLRRAMEIDAQSPTAEPSAALRAPSLLLQLSEPLAGDPLLSGSCAKTSQSLPLPPHEKGEALKASEKYVVNED